MAEKNGDNLFLEDNEDNIDNTYLVFGIEKENYAVNIAHVTEIVGIQRISEVPDVPHFIKGVTNLRGQVIPVMDMRLRFNLPWRDYDDRTTIIVLELDSVSTGLIVDRVHEVVDIQPQQIDPPPSWHKNDNQGVISGLGKTDDNVSIILNVPHLLYDKDMYVDLAKVATHGQAESGPVGPGQGRKG